MIFKAASVLQSVKQKVCVLRLRAVSKFQEHLEHRSEERLPLFKALLKFTQFKRTVSGVQYNLHLL